MVPSSYVRVAAEGTTDEKIFFILVTILKERKREKKRDLLSYILKSTCNRRRHVTCADERGGSYRRQYERMKKKILYKSAGTRYWTGACGYVIQVAIFWRCAVMLVLHRQGNVLLDILKYTEEEEEEKNRRDRAPCDRWPYGFVVAIILTFFSFFRCFDGWRQSFWISAPANVPQKPHNQLLFPFSWWIWRSHQILFHSFFPRNILKSIGFRQVT